MPLTPSLSRRERGKAGKKLAGGDGGRGSAGFRELRQVRVGTTPDSGEAAVGLVGSDAVSLL